VPCSRSHAFIPDHQETDMRPSRTIILSLGAMALLTACNSGGGGAEGEGNGSGADAAAAQMELADDPELANQAAAAEALDTELYGGNAAAGETGNASAAQIPTHTPADAATPPEQPSAR
jgi:hypothetical protein